MACTGQRVDHRQVGAAADGVHEHQHRIRRFGLRLEKVAFQDDQLGDTAVDVPRTGDVLVSNQIRDAVVLVLDGCFGCRHQCCPKSFARTSAAGTSRRRVSIAITDQSTESYSSNLRRPALAPSRARRGEHLVAHAKSDPAASEFRTAIRRGRTRSRHSRRCGDTRACARYPAHPRPVWAGSSSHRRRWLA